MTESTTTTAAPAPAFSVPTPDPSSLLSSSSCVTASPSINTRVASPGQTVVHSVSFGDPLVSTAYDPVDPEVTDFVRQWYSKSELRMMRFEARRLAQDRARNAFLQQQEQQSMENDSVRGLEEYASVEAWRTKRQVILQCVQAVVMEQWRATHDPSGDDDASKPETLRQVSQRRSLAAREQAYERGQQDAQALVVVETPPARNDKKDEVFAASATAPGTSHTTKSTPVVRRYSKQHSARSFFLASAHPTNYAVVKPQPSSPHPAAWETVEKSRGRSFHRRNSTGRAAVLYKVGSAVEWALFRHPCRPCHQPVAFAHPRYHYNYNNDDADFGPDYDLDSAVSPTEVASLSSFNQHQA